MKGRGEGRVSISLKYVPNYYIISYSLADIVFCPMLQGCVANILLLLHIAVLAGHFLLRHRTNMEFPPSPLPPFPPSPSPKISPLVNLIYLKSCVRSKCSLQWKVLNEEMRKRTGAFLEYRGYIYFNSLFSSVGDCAQQIRTYYE